MFNEQSKHIPNYGVPWLICGLIALFVISLTYVFAGDNIVIAPHDQLDSTVDNFLLSIKHWNDGYVPELMGGVSVQELGFGPLVTRTLFTFLPDYCAYAVNMCLVMLISYASMFSLLRMANCRPPVCLIASTTFALLPFFSLHGLSTMGIPLMICASLLLWKNPSRKRFLVASLITFVYGAWSSLILSGFIVLLGLVILGVFSLVRKQRNGFRNGLMHFGLFSILIITYVATNPYLLLTLAQASTVQSSRIEMKLEAIDFTLQNLIAFFTTGHYHAISQNILVLTFSVFALLCYWIARFFQKSRTVLNYEDRWKRCSKLARILMYIIGAAFLITVFYFCFHENSIVAIREKLPDSLRTFQFDRFYFLFPTLWYVAFGLAAELLLQLVDVAVSKDKPRRMMRVVCLIIVYCLVAGCGIVTSREAARTNTVAQTIKVNYLKPWLNDSGVLTWRRFFAEDLFSEIDKAIGREKSEYRVVSIGLYPVIAMHSGFYTLDGYRTTYPLGYKHEFRKIIADELEMDEELRVYFDEWGSRCYAFSHEVGKNYTVPKDSELAIRDLRFNLQQFKNMGGEYIISAVPITSPSQYSLITVGDYVSDDSFFHLYVYRVESDENDSLVDSS